MYIVGTKYRDSKYTALYAFDGAELNTLLSLLLQTRPKGAIALANEMSAKYSRRRVRTWSEQTVYAGIRILKRDLRSQGWYLLSSRAGYSISRNRGEAMKSAERWIQHGNTVIETAKESVR